MTRLRKMPIKIVVLTGVLLSVVGLSVTMAGCNSEELHARARQEFESFTPPRSAGLVQNNDTSTSNGGLVGAYYSTNLTFNQVRQHYEKQLVDRGYTFREFKPLKSWDVDYGEQIVHYCKGRMMAGLYTPGNFPTETKYQFSFSISANGFECR